MKKPSWFQGIFPAIVTPMTQDGKIAESDMRGLVRYLLPHVSGFVVCGTTGEFSSLTIEERKQAIRIVVEEVQGKCPVIAGTGGPSTWEAMELTQYAKEIGATAALVVTPYYFKVNFNEIYDHYQELNKIGFPLIAYNIPQCAGSHQRWFTTEGICDLENVIGVKDSSGDLSYFAALTDKLGGKVALFCGNDEVGQAALGMGADGLILASANLIPDIWQKIYHAVKQNDLQTAQSLQAQIQMLVRIVVCNGATQAVKEGLRMMGIPVGDSRLPMMGADAFRREDREEMRIQLERVGKIARREISFEVIPGKTVKSQYFAIPETPGIIKNFTIKVGEGFAGPPMTEVAHIDLLIGKKGGPVSSALNRAYAETKESRKGREVLLLLERPRTLLVPTVTVRTKNQSHLVYEVAASGLKMGIEKTIEDGILAEGILDDIDLIAHVFVHPSASNEKRVKINNFKAIRHAIRKALEGRPSLEELMYEKAVVRHPFRYSP